MRWIKTSLYPAVCSRPPWAPGWCLHCGAPGWKALQHLPPLSGSVQGRTQSTLFGGEKRTVEGVSGKKKRVMICITICKNPQYIRPSRTDTGFCSGPALAGRGGRFFIRIYWSGGPAVCLFIFKNNSPSQFSVWCNQRCSSKRPLRKFSLLPGVSHTITHASLWVHPAEWISWEFHTSTPLYTEGSAKPSLVLSFSLSSTLLSVSERSLWLRERHRASESIIYQSEELTSITETINVGAIFHRRMGTNKNTNRVDWASACPRSSCDLIPPPPLSLSEWLNDGNFETLVARLCVKNLH